MAAEVRDLPSDRGRRDPHARGHAGTAGVRVGASLDPRYVRTHLRYVFPYVPTQPGHNKRLHKLADLMQRVIAHLAADIGLWSDDVWGVDSTPVECGRSRETV